MSFPSIRSFFALICVAILASRFVESQTEEECTNFDLSEQLGVSEIPSLTVDLEPKATKENGLLHDSKLTKYVLVFGIPVFAFEGVSDDRLKKTGTVLAEFLDNDEDGVLYNEDLAAILLYYQTALVITETDEQKYNFFELVKVANCAPAYGTPGIMAHYESSPLVGNPGDDKDRTLGFIVDFLVQFGYPYTYNPERSIIAKKVEEYFKIAVVKGWLRSGYIPDPHALRREYQRWLAKSALGVDEQECYEAQVWKLCNEKKLMQKAPVLYQTMKFSLSVPDGNYDSPVLVKKL